MGISGSTKALMQSRFGLARFGATRFGYFTPNSIMLIAGVDRSTYVWRNAGGLSSVRMQLNQNAEPDMLTFTLKPQAVFLPVANQIVTFSLGDKTNAEFCGPITKVTRRFERGTSAADFSTPWMDIEVEDVGRIANRRQINAVYENVSCTDIIIDVFDTYVVPTHMGLTRASVAQGLPVIDRVVFTDATFMSVATQLANLIDGGCHWDARKDFHFYGSAGDVSPKAGTSPLTLTGTLKSLKSFAVVDDGTQERNRLFLYGKSTTTPLGGPSGVTAPVNVDWLAVAGGGPGSFNLGGIHNGASGGQVLQGTDALSARAYAIVVAIAATVGSSFKGGDSSFNWHLAKGGLYSTDPGPGALESGSATPWDWTVGTPAGNAGGAYATPSSCGGGGSTNAQGGDATPTVGGAGAPGTTSSISGSAVSYGDGGGGSGPTGGTGPGGAGSGASPGNKGTSAAANRGGGAGGGNNNDGGDGGSGVVILSYVTGALTATGGTITTSGGRTIHTFTTSGTFTITGIAGSTVVTVTDIPIDDASVLDAGPGKVRIGGAQILSYISRSGPSGGSGSNPPGSTLTADAAAGATSISIADTTPFTTVPGWASLGDQTIRYTSAGGGALGGVPATGYGSLVAPAQSGAQITLTGILTLSTTGVLFDTAFPISSNVEQCIITDSTTAQAALTAIDGSDGVIEHAVSDENFSVASGSARGAAEVADFGIPVKTITYETEDMNARAGRAQAVSLGAVSGTFPITTVSITIPIPNHLPRRACVASTVKPATLLDAIVTVSN